jgi:hypothetical protein
LKTYFVLALAGLLLLGAQSAAADQETCDQCKYLRCLKSTVERKQNLIAVYQGLLNFWQAHSTDDNGNPVEVRDLGRLAEPDRTRIYDAATRQLAEYGRMAASRTLAVPPAEGCAYPGDSEVSASSDSYETCEVNVKALAEAQSLQPCKELAALTAAHENMHSQRCVLRNPPGTVPWRWVYTNADGSQGEKMRPPKIPTPVGLAAEEIAAYRLEIAGLKPIIEKLEKRCKLRVEAKSEWQVPGPANIRVVATMDQAELKRDEKDRYTGSGAVNWTATADRVGDCTGTVEIGSTRADVAGEIDDKGQLVLSLTYQAAAAALKDICVNPRGTARGNMQFGLAADPLRFSVSAEGGTVTQSHVLQGPEGPMSGSVVVNVIMKEAVAFNFDGGVISIADCRAAGGRAARGIPRSARARARPG